MSREYGQQNYEFMVGMTRRDAPLRELTEEVCDVHFVMNKVHPNKMKRIMFLMNVAEQIGEFSDPCAKDALASEGQRARKSIA